MRYKTNKKTTIIVNKRKKWKITKSKSKQILFNWQTKIYQNWHGFHFLDEKEKMFYVETKFKKTDNIKMESYFL